MLAKTPGAPGATLPIPQIQGRGPLSPYVGEQVQTEGVITGIQKNTKLPGFYLQDVAGDKDMATSDGIFVGTNKVVDTGKTAFEVGQLVSVAGRVGEHENVTTLDAAEKSIKLINKTPLDPDKMPDPTELALPKTKAASLGYLEAREGMLVTLPNALALGPSNKWDQWIAVDEKAHGPQRDFDDKRAGQRLTVSGSLGARGGKPQVQTGDRPNTVSGPLTYHWDEYQVLQSRSYSDIKRAPQPPKMWGDLDRDSRITDNDIKSLKEQVGQKAAGPLDPSDLNGDGKITRTDVKQATERAARVTGAPSFHVASMNMENFFDTVDEPSPVDDERVSMNTYESKLARLAGSISEHLNAPDLLAVQEVENGTVLGDLVNRPELKSLGYKYELLPGVDPRNINVGLLYRGDNVSVSNVRQAQKSAQINDGVVADANGPVLFTRPPLIADVTVKNGERSTDMTMIVNHLKSKFSPDGAPTEPRRLEQAKFLGKLVDDLRTAHPEREVMVVGDLNDHEKSKPIKALLGRASDPRLVSTGTNFIPQGERFTYNFKGQSELIDHILVTPGLAKQVELAGVRHFNSDIAASARWNTLPYGSADHDTPYAQFNFGTAPASAAAAGAAAVQPATAAA